MNDANDVMNIKGIRENSFQKNALKNWRCDAKILYISLVRRRQYFFKVTYTQKRYLSQCCSERYERSYSMYSHRLRIYQKIWIFFCHFSPQRIWNIQYFSFLSLIFCGSRLNCLWEYSSLEVSIYLKIHFYIEWSKKNWIILLKNIS